MSCRDNDRLSVAGFSKRRPLQSEKDILANSILRGLVFKDAEMAKQSQSTCSNRNWIPGHSVDAQPVRR